MKRLVMLTCVGWLAAAGVFAQAPAGPAATVPRSVLLTYVGAYNLPDGTSALIMMEGTHLIGGDAGGAAMELVPKTQTVFSLQGSEVEIEFIKDDNGIITSFLLKGASGTLKFARVMVAPQILAKYIGNYPLSAGVVTVSAGENQLIWEFPGQPKYPMYPISESRFFSEEGTTTAEFGEDPGGATYFILGAPGVEEKVMRK